MKDLGLLNDFILGQTAKEREGLGLFNRCSNENHVTEAKSNGRCTTTYTCSICDITYKIDSSD